MYKQNDFIGKKFKRLLVIKQTKERCFREIVWKCKCDCGNICKVRTSALKSGNTKSCGCLKIETTSILMKKHGLRNHSLYKKWKAIKGRCYDKNNSSYTNYGKRGIKVCKKWKNDFKKFYNWAIENGWKEELQIDRIDNNGDYRPSNCRFVTLQENLKNKRLLSSRNTSGYCGVSWVNRDKKFMSQIIVNKKRYSLGYYINPVHAALARDIYIVRKSLNYKLNLPELVYWNCA